MDKHLIALYVAAILGNIKFSQLPSPIVTEDFDYSKVHMVLSALAGFCNNPEKKNELQEYLSKFTGKNAWKQLVYEEYRRLGYPKVSNEVLL